MSDPSKSLPVRARILVGLLALLGIPALGYSLVHTQSMPIGWLLLAAGAALASYFPVRLPKLGSSEESIRVTASDIFVFLAILMFSPETAVVVGAVDSCLGNLQTKSALRYLFNLCLAASATLVVGYLFFFIWGVRPALQPEQIQNPELFFLSFSCCALVYYFLTTGTLSYVISLTSPTSVLTVWKEDFLWSALISFTGALTAAAVYLSLEGSGVLGLGLVVPIILIVYYAFNINASRLKSLEASQAFLQSTLDSLSSHVAILDESGRILAVNAMWDRATSDHPLLGPAHPVDSNYLEACRSIVGDCAGDAHSLASGIQQVLEGRQPQVQFEYSWQHAEETQWFLVSVTPFERAPSRAVVAQENITRRKQDQNKILQLSYFDPLTGLPNRVYLRQKLAHLIDSLGEDAGKVGLLSLDVDDFRRINESLGYAAGDQLLKMVGRRLFECVYPKISLSDREDLSQTELRDSGNLIARSAADEFIVVLSRLTNGGSVRLIAEEVIASMGKPFFIGGKEVFVTTSVGVVLYPDSAKDVSELLRCAEAARHQAKNRGRNNYLFYSESFTARSVERLDLENALHQALEKGELEVFYQPRINVETGDVVGMEALLRWDNPALGSVPPARFIPIAERIGLIVPIGTWVLETACRQNHSWQQLGLRELRVSVNVSAEQFKRGDLVATTRRILTESGLSPVYLELEITEGILLEDEDETCRVLSELRRMGVAISLDDFGTGYSSLNYLPRFPIDALKIDQSFIQGVDTNKEHASITRTIVSLSQNLKLGVVAEGVERKEELDFLLRYGCHEVQGFYFCRPLPTLEFTRWLEDYQRRIRAS